MSKYDVIFFDLDHTLWDFEKNSSEALLELYHEFNLEYKTGVKAQQFIDHYKSINYAYWEAYRKGEISKEDLRIKRFSHAFGDFGFHDLDMHEKFSDGYVRVSPEKTHLFPNAKEVLDYLNSKYPMYIITNGFQEIQHRKLKNCAIDQYFKAVVTSEMAGVKKPHHEIYRYAIQLAQTSPEKSIMIGDEPHVDLLGAQELGMDQVYFDAELRPTDFKSTYRITDLLELKNLL